MANITITFSQPFTVRFICNLPINWEVQRTRTATGNPSWSGSTAGPAASNSRTIPANTFQSGDVLDWAADVFAPPTVQSSYSITVEVVQGASTTTMTHSGTVAAAGVQSESGSWTCN
jgi:hypothetical protein